MFIFIVQGGDKYEESINGGDKYEEIVNGDTIEDSRVYR